MFTALSADAGKMSGMAVRSRSDEHYWGVVIEAPDAQALADFYVRLLGWRIDRDDGGDFVTIAPPSGVAYLGIQRSPEYVPPVWPAAEGHQQMMMHLDVEVADRDAAVADAVAMGARLADHQPQEDVRVMLDPAGHPFCLYVETH
jgi:catechol 2,3-dioxygenase-like lactoylglutathione lyase family enzyme